MLLKTLHSKIRNRIRHHFEQSALLRPISLHPQVTSRGNVLLSYVQKPFRLPPGQEIPASHPNYWESYQIAKTFLDLGYAVDVINWDNYVFTPTKPYVVLIDSRYNLQRLAPMVPKECVKVFHIDVAHTLFNSWAEMNRLLALQKRRGTTLRLRRFEHPSFGIEYADCATMIGNDFTASTFSYANKPIYRVPVTSCSLYPWSETKNFESNRRRFLWFGSYGLVHKGLDLVLEAFAQMPDYHLTVCGPIKHEPDFEAIYFKELYQTPNIQTVGWVDVLGKEFLDIVNSCIGFVYASASEGQAGSVVTCMHAGLVPIISYECGVDLSNGSGTVLYDSSVESIKQAVQEIADLPSKDLQHMARANWDYARSHYTREQYAKIYREVAKRILNLS